MPGLPKMAIQVLPLSDRIDRAITRLADLQVRAGNYRRSHRQTEQLLDDVDRVASGLHEAVRGERDRVR